LKREQDAGGSSVKQPLPPSQLYQFARLQTPPPMAAALVRACIYFHSALEGAAERRAATHGPDASCEHDSATLESIFLLQIFPRECLLARHHACLHANASAARHSGAKMVGQGATATNALAQHWHTMAGKHLVHVTRQRLAHIETVFVVVAVVSGGEGGSGRRR
jgi:hypothetical protein